MFRYHRKMNTILNRLVKAQENHITSLEDVVKKGRRIEALQEEQIELLKQLVSIYRG